MAPLPSLEVSDDGTGHRFHQFYWKVYEATGPHLASRTTENLSSKFWHPWVSQHVTSRFTGVSAVASNLGPTPLSKDSPNISPKRLPPLAAPLAWLIMLIAGGLQRADRWQGHRCPEGPRDVSLFGQQLGIERCTRCTQTASWCLFFLYTRDTGHIYIYVYIYIIYTYI